MILLSVMLIVAGTLVSCKQEAGGVPAAPILRDPVVNELGEESANLVYNGDFNNGTDSDVVEDGSDIAIQEGVGKEESGALYVFQNSGEGYGEVMVDITKYYGRGKSYYVEASFKNVGGEGTPQTDIMAKISFSVVSGAGYDKYGRTYDVDGQYDFDWMDSSLASETFEKNTVGGKAGVDISDGEWHTISGILDAETIEEMLVSQTQNHGKGGDEVTLHTMNVAFYVGTWPTQDGYKYLLDDVKIIDLNKELDREGRTWVDPTAVVEDEED